MMADGLKDGLIWLRGALTRSDLAALDGIMPQGKGNARLGDPWIFDSLDGVAAIRAQFGAAFRSVRVVGFDKTPDSNWSLGWHQDRVIAVAERHDVPGFENWTSKAGVWHCEPPLDVLREMLFVRLHLDDCDGGNGAMEILPGSHSEGRVDMDRVASLANCIAPIATTAKRGDICVLPMLTVHRSGASASKDSRRCIRLDMAADLLPDPLKWRRGCIE